MENINEVDLEIIKEFINLPLDSLNQYLDSVIEQEASLALTAVDIVPATGAGVNDSARAMTYTEPSKGDSID